MEIPNDKVLCNSIRTLKSVLRSRRLVEGAKTYGRTRANQAQRTCTLAQSHALVNPDTHYLCIPSVVIIRR